MSFATLMVHADVDLKSDARVRLAAQLADRFTSTLIGISACILPPYPAEGAYFITREFVEQERQDILAALERTKASFRAAAGEKGSKFGWLEWRSAIDLPETFVVSQARSAEVSKADSFADKMQQRLMLRRPLAEPFLELAADHPVAIDENSHEPAYCATNSVGPTRWFDNVRPARG